MKKIITTILVTFTLLSQATFAACIGGCPDGQVCRGSQCVSLLDILVPIADSPSDEIKALKALPDASFGEIVATIIRTILAWSMLIALAAIVATAIYYLQSRGNEEDITKARQIILYLVIGMAIMAAAFGFITGIVQFDFFKAR